MSNFFNKYVAIAFIAGFLLGTGAPQLIEYWPQINEWMGGEIKEAVRE